MKSSLSQRLPVAVAAAVLALCASAASARSWVDSTGGSSQAHGELAVTPAGIVPHLGHDSVASHDGAIHGSGQSADSTGGSSQARADRDLSALQARDVASAGRAPINDAH